MKIVVISPAHPLRGGIAASSERLAQALQTEGHEVVIYSFALQYPAFLFPGKTQLTTDAPPANLRIRTVINSINPFNWIVTGRAIAREQPDQIIVRFWLPFMGPSLGTVLRIARWSLRKKTIITALVDNIIPHEKRAGDRIFAQYFVGACDDFVAMSAAVSDEIRSFLPKATPPSKVRFAPHPIYDTYGETHDASVARSILQVPDNVPIILFFGLIRPYKGLDVLLAAMSDPRMAAQRVHLIVAGECYGDESAYENQIQQDGIGDRVHLFFQYVPNESVRTYFSAADLVVQPYKTATQSGVLQIAYHFRKPVVVTRVGGLPEMVEEGTSGYVVEPNDPTAIADAVIDFFEQKRAPKMKEGVEAILSKFSWSHLVKTLLLMPHDRSS